MVVSETAPSELPLFGRDPLLDGFERDLGACAGGRGGALLLGGEVGIGKTRAAEEFAARSADRGFRVVRARCPDVAGAPALWPWQQVLRQLLARPSLPRRLRALLEPGAPILSHEGAEAQRFQLFHELGEFLIERAGDAPLLVVIDDLHCADAASLAFVAQLAPDLPQAPLLLVATWRDTDPERRALEPFLPVLGRHARAIRLEGLDEAAVAQLAEAVAQRRPADAVVRALHERSGGNPFFLRQLAELLVVKGADLARAATSEQVRALAPRGVQEVIRGRLDRLSPALRRALRVAAVAGPEIDRDLFEAVWVSGEESSALPALDEAFTSGVLRASRDTPDRIEFSHALLRESLERELPAAERTRVHGRITEAIARLRPLHDDAWLFAAAHHALQAGPSPAAVALAARAALRALARHGNADAVRWLSRAIELVDADPSLGRTVDTAWLLVRLGTARWRCGDPEGARAAFAEAFALAREAGEPGTATEAAIGLAGRTDATLGPEEEAVRALETALAELGPEPSRPRAEGLARLASALYFAEDAARPDRVSREAVACAEALGDPTALAYALSARYYVLYRPGTLGERIAVARRQLVEALRGDDPNTTALAHFHLMIAGLEAGDFVLADEHLAAYGALAARLRQPFLLWQRTAFAATRALVEGRFGAAESLSQEALVLAREAGSPNGFPLFAAQLYALRREQGRLGELEPMLADLGGALPRMPAFAFARAEALLARGNEAEARAFLHATRSGRTPALPHDINWGAAASIAARVCVALRDTELAAALYDEILPHAGTCFVLGFANVWDGAVDLALGELAILLGRFADADAALAEAERLHARVGARAHLARTWLAQASLHRCRAAAGDGQRSVELARQALDLARELGMEEVAARAGRIADSRAASATPAPASAPGEHRFVRANRGWEIRFAGRDVVVASARGMTYLAALLAAPGKPLHVLDLVALEVPPGAAVAGGTSAGEHLDARARREVRARMRELAGAIDESEARNDPTRAAALREELDATERHLAAALGLGDRARRAGDPVERARKSVYNRLRGAILSIERVHGELARHLRAATRTGRTCCYDPERPLVWILADRR